MATISPKQHALAALAGAVGHVLFALGWFTFGLSLLGGIIAGVLGVSTGAIAEKFGDVPALRDALSTVQGLVGMLVIVVAIGSIVVIVLGYLASGAILRAARLRAPWKTSLVALGIAALVSVPLLFIYGVIANAASVSLAAVSVIGSIVVGVALWMWLVWARRGPASRFAGVSAKATAAPVELPPA